MKITKGNGYLIIRIYKWLALTITYPGKRKFSEQAGLWFYNFLQILDNIVRVMTLMFISTNFSTSFYHSTFYQKYIERK